MLDNISKKKLGAEARVTFLRYCTDRNTLYVSSVQAGITNGVGSENKWLNVIGHDDQGEPQTAVCSIYQLEKDDMRVETIEVGYLNVGVAREQSVIWLRILVRDIKNKGPADSDVTVTIGKTETYMVKRTLKFSQTDAFIGFHGKHSSGTNDPIT